MDNINASNRKLTFPLIEFPQDDNTWLILWFGEVFRQVNFEQYLIEVVLVPIENLRQNIFSVKNQVRESIKVKRVGVGLLPLLQMGSLWNKGTPVNTAGDHQKEFVVTVTTPLAAPIEKIGKYDSVRPYHRFKEKHLESPCVVLKRGITLASAEFDTVIIPCIEIARFYHCNSSVLTTKLFNGGLKRKEVCIGKKNFLHPHKAPAVIDKEFEEGKAYVVLAETMPITDAAVIARMVHSEDALRSAARIFNSIDQAKQNDRPMYPQSLFPFSTPTDLKVRGKRFKLPGNDGKADVWGLLVYSIQSCTGAFPFNELECYQLGNHQEGDDQSNVEAMNWPPKVGSDILKDTPLHSGSQPDSSRLAKVVQIPVDSRFIGYPEKIYRAPKPYQRYRNDASPAAPAAAPDTVTTEPWGIDGANTAPVKIKTKEQQKAEAEKREIEERERLEREENKRLAKELEDRAKFFKIFFESMKAFEKDFNCCYRQVNPDPSMPEEKNLSTFYGVMTMAKEEMPWYYSFYNKIENTWTNLRRVAILEIENKEQYFYIFEVEPTYMASKFKTCLIYENSRKKLKNSDLEVILNFYSQKRGRNLGKEAPSLAYRSQVFKHTSAKLVNKIVGFIKK